MKIETLNVLITFNVFKGGVTIKAFREEVSWIYLFVVYVPYYLFLHVTSVCYFNYKYADYNYGLLGKNADCR